MPIIATTIDASQASFCADMPIGTRPTPGGRPARTSRMPGQAFSADNLLTSVMDFGADGTGLILHNELHRGGMNANRVRVEGDQGTISFGMWDTKLTLRADRMNAYEQWGRSLPEALKAEWERSKHRIGDGLQGAARFAAGEGRHGKF